MSDIGITYKFLYKLSQYSEIPAVSVVPQILCMYITSNTDI